MQRYDYVENLCLELYTPKCISKHLNEKRSFRKRRGYLYLRIEHIRYAPRDNISEIVVLRAMVLQQKQNHTTGSGPDSNSIRDSLISAMQITAIGY